MAALTQNLKMLKQLCLAISQFQNDWLSYTFVHVTSSLKLEIYLFFSKKTVLRVAKGRMTVSLFSTTSCTTKWPWTKIQTISENFLEQKSSQQFWNFFEIDFEIFSPFTAAIVNLSCLSIFKAGQKHRNKIEANLIFLTRFLITFNENSHRYNSTIIKFLFEICDF